MIPTPEERAEQICSQYWPIEPKTEAPEIKDEIVRAIREAVEAEREECAKIAEAWSVDIPDQETYYGTGIYTTVEGDEIAELIRARK